MRRSEGVPSGPGLPARDHPHPLGAGVSRSEGAPTGPGLSRRDHPRPLDAGMGRSRGVPSGPPAAARSTRRDARRRRRGVSCPGSGGAADPAATRERAGALVVAGLVAGAVALLAPADDSQAQSRIGRLFSTPEQRAELDRLRESAGAEEAAAPTSEPAPRESRPGTEREAPPLAATFNGIVVRGGSHRVAWIDGIETPAGGSTPAGVRFESGPAPDGRLRVRLSLGRTTAVLSPGQSVDAHGAVRDGYERHPGTPAARTNGEGASDAPAPGGEGATLEVEAR